MQSFAQQRRTESMQNLRMWIYSSGASYEAVLLLRCTACAYRPPSWLTSKPCPRTQKPIYICDVYYQCAHESEFPQGYISRFCRGGGPRRAARTSVYCARMVLEETQLSHTVHRQLCKYRRAGEGAVWRKVYRGAEGQLGYLS